MAALTQARSLLFLKALRNNAIDTGTFEGDRIVVRRVSDAVLALKKHGWTRVSTLGKSTVIARRDNSWPVVVHRDAIDGRISVEPPVVDNVEDLETVAALMTPSAKLRKLVSDWQAAQEAKGAVLEVTWNDPSTPHFKDKEFINAPGVCITAHRKDAVSDLALHQLSDAADHIGIHVRAYGEKVDGLNYVDVYFLPKTH